MNGHHGTFFGRPPLLAAESNHLLLLRGEVELIALLEPLEKPA
jgi:hypothetical protein